MKKRIAGIALALTLGAGCLALGGCAEQGAKPDVNADIPEGAAPLMPAGHEGRFESLGAAGCYGCHGASRTADPMLAGAVSFPDDHYAGGNPSSLMMDPVREQCNTCHVQG